jgi:hypothetical protein
MSRRGYKNRYPKHMCSKEIGLCAPNTTTIVGSIINIIGKGGGYVTI